MLEQWHPIFLSSLGGMYEKFHEPAVIIAGFFVAIALALSIYLILQHLRSYTNPAVSYFPHCN